MARVGLVLGGGGVVGQAYHAGVLAALEQDFGFDPRTVEIIVGTSAGSITGTLLRMGVSAGDLAAWVVKAPLSDEDDEVLQRMAQTTIPELAAFRPGRWLRQVRPPTVHMVRRAVLRPWQFRPMAAGLALLAPGGQDVVEQLSALREKDDAPWPSRDLWICAIRRRDGRRIVFGRPGAPEAPIHLAVAASCALPGIFTPVRIGDHTYVDGSGHSPTNAALLRSCGVDLVVVLSPMSGPPGRPSLYAALRRHSAQVLQREIRALQHVGIKTVVFSPGAEEQRVMGDDIMSVLRLHEVVYESFRSAGVHAATPEVAELIRSATDVRRSG